MDASLCAEALNMAVEQSDCLPDIFNTDQGSQFTSEEWTQSLLSLGIRISMDGKGRWMYNVFIERLWRSLKYEEIYLREYSTLVALEPGLERWFEQYNTWQAHESLGNRTPHRVHEQRGEVPLDPMVQQAHNLCPHPRQIFWFFHSGEQMLFRYAPEPLFPSVPEPKNRAICD